MLRFTEIHKLLPFIKDSFSEFYETMLKDTRLSIFFDSDEQIKELVKKQKMYFAASLSMPEIELKKAYIKLGEYHFDIRIPYIDFIKGTEILQEHFLKDAQNIAHPIALMNDIFGYFKIMKAYTAKGYLNRMIQDDRKDIELFFKNDIENDNSHLPRSVILQKIDWLKELLGAIENGTSFDHKLHEDFFHQWIEEADFLSKEKQLFYKEIETRILINARNLFYFLERGEYLEILPLYASLLDIYKLTLILNNSLTIEYANKVINDMQVDPMTKLFRKEIFIEILKKELAIQSRQEHYKFSIVYIDIDDLKYINDTYGHYSGDKAIESLGSLIKTTIRSSDMGFRIGGDEFALILRDATKENAKKVCAKILADMHAIEFVFNEKTTFKVGLSIGIVEQNSANILSQAELIKAVDEKLYESKRQGKNRITI